MRRFRKVVYSIKKPQLLLADIDSTLLDTHGHQEGEGFNFHYRKHGYHPLVCYDGMTGDLLEIELRNGTDYTSTGVAEFLQPLLDEFQNDYPELPLLLRGDSGFAKPELYEQCETNGVSYVIRLKENNILRELAADIDEVLTETTQKDMVSYAVSYGEFMYQAGSWKRLVLPARMRNQQIDSIRLKLLKIAAKVIYSARYIVFKLCSSCPYKDEFYETLENIRGLRPQLE